MAASEWRQDLAISPRHSLREECRTLSFSDQIFGLIIQFTRGRLIYEEKEGGDYRDCQVFFFEGLR